MPKAIKQSRTNQIAEATPRSARLLAFSALLVMAFVALALVTRPASTHADTSQTLVAGTPQPAPAPQPDPPGTIDGAKNPELVPDDVAYRLVFLAFSEPENATDAQKARFRAKLTGAGLDDDDIEAFRIILGHLQTQLDDVRA